MKAFLCQSLALLPQAWSCEPRDNGEGRHSGDKPQLMMRKMVRFPPAAGATPLKGEPVHGVPWLRTPGCEGPARNPFKAGERIHCAVSLEVKDVKGVVLGPGPAVVVTRAQSAVTKCRGREADAVSQRAHINQSGRQGGP
ncbi:hypothetical protein AAFF_G00137810 [Aldrovandia affinis]|uniref:Secreted protein n=1 Tax=Aldrovandia affinis TaxID=143900 RepID=A0AAD7TCG3_9TELE|nr:hypothetical protein AAFF_G00137810 [Aldrovandia affinis]